jgi:hypothetical protein
VSEVQSVRIDEEGRYIILVRYPDGDSVDFVQTSLKLAHEQLRKWWEGDDKFLLLAVGNGVEVRFERVDKEVTEE